MEAPYEPSHSASYTLGDTSFINNIIQMANNAYNIKSKGRLIKYLHQCLFRPPKTSLIKYLQNNQLPTWSGLTDQAVEKHLS